MVARHRAGSLCGTATESGSCRACELHGEGCGRAVTRVGWVMLARLMETYIWWPHLPVCGRAQLRNSGTWQHFSLEERYPSTPCPEAGQFSFSLYVPGAFWAAMAALELGESIHDHVSLCLGYVTGHLCLQQPSLSLRWNPPWFSQSDVWTLPSSLATGLGARYRVTTLCSYGGPLQPRYPSQLLSITCVCVIRPFHVPTLSLGVLFSARWLSRVVVL